MSLSTNHNLGFRFTPLERANISRACAAARKFMTTYGAGRQPYDPSADAPAIPYHPDNLNWTYEKKN